MNSLLCNWFEDWGRAIKNGLGSIGVIIFLVVFSCIALTLIYSIMKGILGSKTKIKWGRIIIVVILILLIIWFAIIL